MTERSAKITIKAWRYDPDKPADVCFQEYAVDSDEPLSVMALLSKIREQDPSFACRTSTCFKGKCGSCLVKVNGKDVFGCTTLIQPGEVVVVEPHSKFRVIRDVVVDFSQPLLRQEAADHATD